MLVSVLGTGESIVDEIENTSDFMVLIHQPGRKTSSPRIRVRGTETMSPG